MNLNTKETDLEEKKRVSILILQNCRNELYHYFPYLDGAFASMGYQCEAECTWIRTDGESVFVSPEQMIRQYMNSQIKVTRGYLHMLLHCLYLHPWPWQRAEQKRWDLASDLAVEVMIECEKQKGLSLPEDPVRKRIFTMLCPSHPGAEEIYQMLREQMLGDEEELRERFAFDDHSFWYEKQSEEKRQALRQKWMNVSRFTSDQQKKQKKAGSLRGYASEEMIVNDNRRYDFSRYLKQFAITREEVELDQESFDYIFYHLGMERFGDMPLIEPLEYKEVNRLEELVIAIDTSGSCSKEVVQQFLTETYGMLSQRENFFKKMNVTIIQCDTHIQEAAMIHSEEEWKQYSKNVRIQGRGGTDFRPVFRYVEEMRKQKVIRNLKALLYFTDGDGIYPREKTEYETAFVFLKEKAKTDQVPEWAKILMI